MGKASGGCHSANSNNTATQRMVINSHPKFLESVVLSFVSVRRMCPGCWTDEPLLVMKAYQKEFIEFALEVGALKFGKFLLKSGRESPFYFTTGVFNTGQTLARLAGFYAAAIADSGLKFDVLFGPAYKGIPLASATVMALYNNYDMDAHFAFNRKEEKTHGDGGKIVGSLKGRVLVIDDVVSAGTSVRESAELIKGEHAELAGVIVSLDRQEKGTGDLSAIQEIQNMYSVPVMSIVNVEILYLFIRQDPNYAKYLPDFISYQKQYGTSQLTTMQ